MYDEENDDVTGDDMLPEDEEMGFSPLEDELGDGKMPTDQDSDEDESYERDRN